jgi:energy-coupling factor transport system permease protein
MNTLTWLAWLGAALIVTGLGNNPLYMLLALLAATLVFLACQQETPLARAYRFFFLAGLLLWLGTMVFSVITVGGARGKTVLATLPAYTFPALLGGVTVGGPIAAEDLAWGAARGLRLWALLAIFGAFNALVDHYRLLRLTPRSLFHAGLAVTIGVSFVPGTVRAAGEIIEAQRVRGHRFGGPRAYLALIGPLLASSLERSIQLAEALDARGYGRTCPDGRARGGRQAALLAGLLLLGGGVFGWLYYGVIWALALAGAGAAALGWGMWRLGRLVPRTIYRRERWRRRDTFVALAAGACAAGWIALWASGAGGLLYNPYPRITPPPFDPLAGALAALLAVPALAGGLTTDHEGRTHARPQSGAHHADRTARPSCRVSGR